MNLLERVGPIGELFLEKRNLTALHHLLGFYPALARLAVEEGLDGSEQRRILRGKNLL
jgi:hypothetical protein